VNFWFKAKEWRADWDCLIQLKDMGHTNNPLIPPDFIVSIGGDGTLIDCVPEALTHDVPILGVNYGTVGYLALDPGTWQPIFRDWLENPTLVQYRKTLKILRNGWTPRSALNEVFIGRDEHLVTLDVYVDDQSFHTYRADGLIVATASGSTAYAFSVGGPIMDPTFHATVIVPVAPHSLFNRAVVVPGDSKIEIEVAGDRPCTPKVVVDGQATGTAMLPGERMTILPGAAVKLIGLKKNFLETLRSKFKDL
jgi:NAD+ kinase